MQEEVVYVNVLGGYFRRGGEIKSSVMISIHILGTCVSGISGMGVVVLFCGKERGVIEWWGQK
jgi:hypothetical protein